MFEYLKAKARKLWDFLSGKKRNIALVYWSVVVPAVGILWPERAPEAVDKTVAFIGLFLSYIGLGHAVIKTRRSASACPTENEREVIVTDETPKEGE